MPTVLRVGRYRFFFFSNEGREPAHIHVKAEADEAKFWLEPVTLAANHGFKAHELRQIEEIVQDHLHDLIGAWNEHFNG